MCNNHDEETSYGHEAPPSGGISRRGLFAAAGVGVGLALTGLPALARAATNGEKANVEAEIGVYANNGAWCNPAQGTFPNGGHFGAPRGGTTHAGQDISNPSGTAIYAAAAGTVIRRGTNVLTGRTGNGIVIQHSGGIYTYYGHLNAFRVAQGAKVSAGQRIGDMGTTGNVTGPHLHFETHNGSLGAIVNPVPFMAARGVNLRGGWPTLDPGAQGARVRAIQLLLNQRGASLVVDGDHGPKSVAALKSWQSSNGLVADGQAGPKTWPKLVYTLKQGANGNHVRALQTAMNMRSAGLEVDGDFGGVTNTAVRTFQTLNRLVSDGEAGPITWQAIVN